MAKRRRNDSGLEGVLLVDKPDGPTSFDVVAQMRRALGTRTIGHTGTLDPCANGLLVILVGRYTRLSNYLTNDDKLYVGKVAFGTRTTTDDREGEVLESGDASALTAADVQAALKKMQGPCRQRPPAFSAVSVGGERLYKKARRGEAVEAPEREVTLHALELLSFEQGEAEIRVLASKGTYIRSIARDLGVAVGVPAHLSALRRLRAGAYDVAAALPLETLREPGRAAAALRSGPDAVAGVPRLEVDATPATHLRQGKRVSLEAALPARQLPPNTVALAHHGAELIALVRVSDGHLVVERGFGPPPQSQPEIP